MGSTNSQEVYEYDVTDDQIGPVLLNRQSAALTARFGTRLDWKMVANIADRTAYYAAFGTGTVARPCVVYRADASAGQQIEYNDGSGWKPYLTHKLPIRMGWGLGGTAGAATYTPTPGVWYIEVECVGGGGGGGGAAVSGTGGTAVAGAGGGGGYAKKIIYGSALSPTVTITVGAGGAGGVAGANNGSSGLTSSFGALLTATGGTGGVGAPNTVITMVARLGGVGGSGTLGDIIIPGQPGSNGIGSTDAVAIPSVGGDSFLGRGASAAYQVSGAGAAGTNGGSYGGGGSGGYNRGASGTPAKAGGNGTNGIVIVTEYF